MTAISITPGYPTFADTDGSPLNDGYVFIGLENQDPITAPTGAFWDKEFRIPADQPLRTSGGYVVRSGTPAAVYTGAAYSILVQNKNLVTVYNAPSAVITNVTNDVEEITQYQGAHAADPIVRNDGAPLQVGDLYFNSVVNELNVWTGSAWVPASPGAITVQNFTGTGAQTAFNLATAPVAENNTQIYIDGVYQQKDTYTVSGATINFSIAPTNLSGIEVVTFSIAALGTVDASNVSYNEGGVGAVNTSVQSKLQESISVLDFGADPTGATDSTVAINAAVGALPAGGTLLFPVGTYSISSPIIFDGKNATVSAYGANFTLVGDNTGFVVKGTITNFTVLGGSITGDNNATRLDSSTAQIGWLIGDAVGATINNVTIRDVKVSQANVGFKASYGSVTPPAVPPVGIIAYNVRFINCEAVDSAGSTGGVGYGFQFAQVSGGMIDNCLAANCTRHGIYLSEGADYTISNCYVKDGGIGGGVIRGAIAISRSNNVTVTGCSIDNANDVGMVIDDDAQGLGPDNYSKNITISGCTFKANVYGGIWVGENLSPPDTPAGLVENLIINACTFHAYPSTTSSEIRINSGKNIVLSNSILDASNADPNHTIVALINTGGPSYTDNISLIGNQFVGVQNRAVELAAGLATNNVNLRFGENSGISYLWTDGASNATNNSVYTDDLGQIGNSGATPNIGAGNRFLLTQTTGAESVTSFVGGYEGKRISIQFGDSNSTLTTNMYLAGNTNFAAAINDQIVLEYCGTEWREISRTTQS